MTGKQQRGNVENVCVRGRLTRIPILMRSDVVYNPFQLRLLVLMVTQLITVMAIISQVAVLCRDIKWNNILDGSALVSFPTPPKIWIDRYIIWDDPQLKNVLARGLIVPILCVFLLFALLIFNVMAQIYDSNGLSLLVESIIYTIFGLFLLLLACAEVYYTTLNIQKGFEQAGERLLELVPLDEDIYPDKFPFGNPIFVSRYPQYFLQVAYSCRDGDVIEWEQKSELMGITEQQITIPSYHQLVNMGFCVGWKVSYFPMAFLGLLSILSWLNVAFCLRARSCEFLLKVKVPLPPPPFDLSTTDEENGTQKLVGNV